MPDAPRPSTHARVWVEALDPDDLDGALRQALSTDGPALVEVFTDVSLL
jgi:thiamine pyrophosphate-dependent acetolactate synthase large subunit-like protein